MAFSAVKNAYMKLQEAYPPSFKASINGHKNDPNNFRAYTDSLYDSDMSDLSTELIDKRQRELFEVLPPFCKKEIEELYQEFLKKSSISKEEFYVFNYKVQKILLKAGLTFSVR